MKKFLSLVLALVMTMSLVTVSAGAKDFTDNSSITYKEAVDVISAIGVVDGYTDGSFNPANTLTRGAAAKIICNLILGPTTASVLKADAAPFKDVAVDNVFAGYIAYCASQGIINGYADGTFRPAGTLSGYAFMKMLLGALGYDAKIENYVGDNWSINVAKQSLNLGLNAGLATEFNGQKAVNREEACLYAFNMLQKKMVSYANKGTNISIGGVEFIAGASAAVEGSKTFAQTYFSKLSKNANDEDAFGRPATSWTYNKSKVGTYTKAADASYVGSVAGKTIYADLGLKADIAGANVDEIINGGAAKNDKGIAKKDGDTKFGAGNGSVVEVYAEKIDGDVVGATVIVVETYVGKVTSVGKDADGNRLITVDGMTYKTDDFAKNDIVLYTAVGESIKSIELAEKLEGKLTKKVGSKYTIDGSVYSLSAQAEVADDIAVKDEVAFYLDNYGFIIKMDKVADAAAKVTVADLALVQAYQAATEWDAGRAKLLFADGSKKTVNVSKVTGNVAASGNTLVSFKVKDNGEYELTAVSAELVKGAAAIKKGTPALAGKVADSKTVYVYITNSGKDVNVYTGYKNAPSIAQSSVYGYAESGKSVALVFVIGDKVDDVTSSTDLIYIALNAKGDLIDDGENQYYTFSAVQGGKVVSVDVKASLVESTGVVAFEKVTMKDGLVTAFGAEKAMSTASKVKVENEIIVLDETAMAYADSTLVIFVKDSTLTVGTIDEVDNDAEYKSVSYATKDGVVNTLILGL